MLTRLVLTLFCLWLPRLIVFECADVMYFKVADCLAFIAQNISLIDVKSSKEYLLLPTDKLKESSCDGKISSMVIETSTSGGTPKVSIGLIFKLDKQHWSISDAKVNITCEAGAKQCSTVNNAILNLDWLAGPLGSGYKCLTPPEVLLSGVPNAVEWRMKLYWLQVQPFGAKDGVFGPAVDCTRYFTIPIWSTLIVSFLLIGVLTYGLQMLMSIKPNATFEDPKGKSVQLGGKN